MDEQKKYNAFRSARDGEIDTTDHQYTGQKLDSTGLMYYNARYYDPAIGQFISPDTIVPDPSNVSDYNRYMYVRGNPINMNDPSGHCSSVSDGGLKERDPSDGECWEKADAYLFLLENDPYLFERNWGAFSSPERWFAHHAYNELVDAEVMSGLIDEASRQFNARTGLAAAAYKSRNATRERIPKPCNAGNDYCLPILNDVVGLVSTGGAIIACIPGAAACGGFGAFFAITGGLSAVGGTGWTAYRHSQGAATDADLVVVVVTATTGAVTSLIPGVKYVVPVMMGGIQLGYDVHSSDVLLGPMIEE